MPQSEGCNTHPPKSPHKRFPLPPMDREPWPVPPSVPGYCELCGEKLKRRGAKFCPDRWGFSCREQFYQLVLSVGRQVVPRLLLERRRRPRRKGQHVDEISKRMRREIRMIIDDFDMRRRAGAATLRAAEAAAQDPET